MTARLDGAPRPGPGDVQLLVLGDLSSSLAALLLVLALVAVVGLVAFVAAVARGDR